MNKHTPGPWFVENVSHKKQRADISTLEKCQTTGNDTWRGLARAYGQEDDPRAGSKAMMANARLIAAAPDLLQAVRGLLDALPSATTHPAIAAARAAIAKATGGEQ